MAPAAAVHLERHSVFGGKQHRSPTPYGNSTIPPHTPLLNLCPGPPSLCPLDSAHLMLASLLVHWGLKKAHSQIYSTKVPPPPNRPAYQGGSLRGPHPLPHTTHTTVPKPGWPCRPGICTQAPRTRCNATPCQPRGLGHCAETNTGNRYAQKVTLKPSHRPCWLPRPAKTWVRLGTTLPCSGLGKVSKFRLLLLKRLCASSSPESPKGPMLAWDYSTSQLAF